MNKIKRCLEYYIGYRVSNRLAIFSLVSLYRREGRATEFEGIEVLCGEDVCDEFFLCVCEALSLLKKWLPREFRVVKRNLRFVVNSSGKYNYLGKYAYECCMIPWSKWPSYPPSTLARIMASVLVYSAYYGEYLRRFGSYAYRNSYVSRKCWNREVRVLLYFKGESNDSDLVVMLDRRIRTVKNHSPAVETGTSPVI